MRLPRLSQHLPSNRPHIVPAIAIPMLFPLTCGDVKLAAALQGWAVGDFPPLFPQGDVQGGFETCHECETLTLETGAKGSLRNAPPLHADSELQDAGEHVAIRLRSSSE